MSNEPDVVNSGALATAIVLVAFSTLAVGLVVTALVRNTTKDVQVDKLQTQERSFRSMKSEQLASLTATPAYSDRATQRVSVPIERAMDIVLADIRANPYAMSPGFKPKEECAEGEVCVECAEGEVCPKAACDAGQKCAVETVCKEGEDCEVEKEASEEATAPESATPEGGEPSPSAQPAAPGSQPSVSPQQSAPGTTNSKAPAQAPNSGEKPKAAPAPKESPAPVNQATPAPKANPGPAPKAPPAPKATPAPNAAPAP